MTKHYNSFGGKGFGRIRKSQVRCRESILRQGLYEPHSCRQPRKGSGVLGSGAVGGSVTPTVGGCGHETELFGSLWKCGGKEIESLSSMYSLTNTWEASAKCHTRFSALRIQK